MATIKANFHLKDSASDLPTLILLKAYFNRMRFVYSTGQYILPLYWDDSTQRPVTVKYEYLRKQVKVDPGCKDELNEYTKTINKGKSAASSFLEDMDHISNQLNRYQDELRKKYEYLENQEIPVTPQALKELLNKEFRKDVEVKSTKGQFQKAFDEYLEHLGATKSTLTVKKFKTLQKSLKEFSLAIHYPITFESIDLNFYDKYKRYLLKQDNPIREEKGLLNGTIGKYVSALKTFMQWSLDRNYHTNRTFQMREFKVDRKVKHEIITLTEKELNTIWKHDLSDNPRLDRVRDLFCFATFTGQRWSDIIALKEEDIKVVQKGAAEEIRWIFESKKTREKREVPFVGFSAPALDILKKYEYKLPVISLQNYNNYLKELGDEADIDEEVKIIRYIGSQRLEIKKPKYNFMSSHMARRTCVTILLERGVPPTTVMRLTGHKDLKTLMKYENTGEDALAESLEKVGTL